MNDPKGSCWKCGRVLLESELSRQETCPGCRSDTRVCRNCAHYDPSRNNQCRESAAELVTEKTKSNFCDWFRPVFRDGGGAEARREDAAKAAFEKLFKKK